jgi:YVTN family beta-propeller protein
MTRPHARLSITLALCAVALPLSGWAQSAAVAYVSNQGDGVIAIDLGTLEISATLDIAAKGPRGIGVSGDGKYLVTANMGSGNLSVIDTATGKLVRQVAIGKSPEYLRVVGDTAYVTYEPKAQAPAPLASGAQRSKDEDDDDKTPGHIVVVDLKSGQVLRDITGKPETEGLEFSKGGKELIVTNESDSSLGIYDNATGKLIRTVSLVRYGDRPRGIKVSPDGSTYLVTLEVSNKLLVLNADFEVIKEIATANAPYGVAFNRSGDRVYVAAARDRVLQVFDAGTWAKIKDIPSANRCWHFSFTPDDQKILLACGRSNEVLVIDVNALEVVKHIAGFQLPWGIVTLPRSVGTIDAP